MSKEVRPAKELWNFLDSEYVKAYHGGRIEYTKDFYIAMYKKITEEKLTYVDAYNALGFDTDVLGVDRANSAGKRAVRMAEEGRLDTVDPSSYDGSVPRIKMGNLSPAEEMAYMKARITYLEKVIEFQKKIPSELAALRTSLKAKK